MASNSDLVNHITSIEDYKRNLDSATKMRDRLNELIDTLSSTVDWLNEVSEVSNGTAIRVIAGSENFDISTLGDDLITRVAHGTRDRKGWNVVFREDRRAPEEHTWFKTADALKQSKIWVSRASVR